MIEIIEKKGRRARIKIIIKTWMTITCRKECQQRNNQNNEKNIKKNKNKNNNAKKIDDKNTQKE